MAETQGTRNFTAEQIALLEDSAYVGSVGPNRLTFTPWFKEHFYERLHAGESARSIFLHYDLDPDLIGQTRINNFVFALRQKMKKDGNFEDKRQYNGRYARNKDNGTDANKEKKTLEKRVAHLEEVIEALKKTHAMEIQAQKRWLAAQQHRKNISSSTTS